MLEILNRVADSLWALITCIPDGMRLRDRMLNQPNGGVLFDTDGRVIGR